MTRILAIADQVDEGLYGEKLTSLRPDLVLSCGDLPFEYLENLVSRLDVPLLFVPGNHDPALGVPDQRWAPLAFEAPEPGPRGCLDVDLKIVEVAGLRVAGLGGSPRYRPGPNQYSERQMARRAWRLRLSALLRSAGSGRPAIDVLLTHAPPAGAGDARQDALHRGFQSLARLDRALSPRLHVHGHVLHYGAPEPETRVGSTLVVNAIPYRLLEL